MNIRMMEINRNVLSKSAQALIAGMVDDTGEIDKDSVHADPEVWEEVQGLFPRRLFDDYAEAENDDTWTIPKAFTPAAEAPTPEAGAMSTSDGLGPVTALEPPEGCTGAVMYAQDGSPSIQHDLGTCPIHEPYTDVAALDAIHVYVADSLEANGRVDTAGLTGKVVEELRKAGRQF